MIQSAPGRGAVLTNRPIERPDAFDKTTFRGDLPAGWDAELYRNGQLLAFTSPNGDGRYDDATVFLDGLSYPTGVKVWGKGILVTAAPEIFYAEDTDGDGVADKREVWFSGFARSNQQHRVNGIAWGLDNWLHVANGDGGGVIGAGIGNHDHAKQGVRRGQLAFALIIPADFSANAVPGLQAGRGRLVVDVNA